MGRVFCPDRIAHFPSNPLNVSKAVSELPGAAEAASIRKSRKPTLRKIILNSFFRRLSRNLLPVSSGSRATRKLSPTGSRPTNLQVPDDPRSTPNVYRISSSRSQQSVNASASDAGAIGPSSALEAKSYPFPESPFIRTQAISWWLVLVRLLRAVLFRDNHYRCHKMHAHVRKRLDFGISRR